MSSHIEIANKNSKNTYDLRAVPPKEGKFTKAEGLKDKNCHCCQETCQRIQEIKKPFSGYKNEKTSYDLSSLVSEISKIDGTDFEEWSSNLSDYESRSSDDDSNIFLFDADESIIINSELNDSTFSELNNSDFSDYVNLTNTNSKLNDSNLSDNENLSFNNIISLEDNKDKIKAINTMRSEIKNRNDRAYLINKGVTLQTIHKTKKYLSEHRIGQRNNNNNN